MPYDPFQPFESRVQTYPGGVLLSVAGEIDVDTTPLLRDAVSGAVGELAQIGAGGGPELIVDLRAVKSIDSAGLGPLIGARQTVGENFTVVYLPGSQVARVLEVIHADKYLRLLPLKAGKDLSGMLRAATAGGEESTPLKSARE
jgi:anti-anti-sigma factor